MRSAGRRFPDLRHTGSGSRRVRAHSTGTGRWGDSLRHLHAAGRRYIRSPCGPCWRPSADGTSGGTPRTREAKATADGFHVTADPADGTITVNGITYLGIVYVQNGRTYVPLRLLVTQLGGGVSSGPLSGRCRGLLTRSGIMTHRTCTGSAASSALKAGGESLQGQIAVGNVVLNRVADDAFPDTIPAVIFDRKHGTQFQPVDNGTVYQSPTALSTEAARQVLDGGGFGGCAFTSMPPPCPRGHGSTPTGPTSPPSAVTASICERGCGLTFCENGGIQ